MSQHKYTCKTLNSDQQEKVLQLLVEVFQKEQGIPEHYLPVPFPIQQTYGVFTGPTLVGVAVGWYDGQLWHWGRFAIHTSHRGKGLGKVLAAFSFRQLFDQGIDMFVIEARDITVNLLLGLGATVTGDPYDIFGKVTPMELTQEAFNKK